MRFQTRNGLETSVSGISGTEVHGFSRWARFRQRNGLETHRLCIFLHGNARFFAPDPFPTTKRPGNIRLGYFRDGRTVSIDGQDLSKINLRSFRKHLGVVLQDDFLYEGTIKENILFPRPEASDEEVLAAAEGAYVTEFTDRFDEGLDTLIGERGVKLSGGQRQRISIARALLAQPALVILDEATSNLDTESERYIQDSLSILMKDRTTLVIAHRLSTIQKADQILVIEKGEIVEKGKHQELLDKQGRYFELYTYQTRM